MSESSPSVAGRIAALAATLLASLAVGPAWACEVTVIRAPGDVILRYDPFDAQNAPAELSIAVRNRGAEPCAFDIALLDKDRTAQRRLVLQPSGLEVEVRAAGGAAAALTSGAEPGVWRGTAPGGEQGFGFTIAVVKDAVPPAGRLELPLSVELRTPGSATPLEPATPVKLVIESPPRAQLNIAGATGYFGSAPSVSTVDLGELAPGVRKRLFLQVRSNVALSRLMIRSENRGLLLPVAKEARVEGASVSYHAVLEDAPVNLREVFERRIGAPPTLAGQSLPFEIVVDEFEGRPAGAYSDTLTIDFSPL